MSKVRSTKVIPAYKVKLDKIRLIEELGLEPQVVVTLEDGSEEVQSSWYPEQKAFIESNKRFKFFRGARRIGKSHTAGLDAFPEVLKEGTRGWIVGPNYETSEKEFRYILDFLRRYIKKQGLDIRKFTIHDNFKNGNLYIKTPWNSEVTGKSASNKVSLVGEELDWVIMSEAAQQDGDTWRKYVLPTLTTRKGRAIFPTTPDSAGEWLYDLEIKAEGNPNWEIFHAPQWSVPHIDKEEIEIARSQMSKDEFEEQIGGEWRFFSGRVYNNFSKEKHIIEPFKIPETWQVYAGLDFGLRDATVMLYTARSPLGDYYVFHEYYKNNISTQDHCHSILQFERTLSNRIMARIADYHALGRQLMLDWQHNGIRTIPCVNDVSGKRDRLLSMFEPREMRLPYHIAESGVNDKGTYPRVFVMRNCEALIHELMWLRWKETSRKEGSAGDTLGEDHAINALEYLIHYATDGEYTARRRSLFKPRQQSWGSFVT